MRLGGDSIMKKLRVSDVKVIKITNLTHKIAKKKGKGSGISFPPKNRGGKSLAEQRLSASATAVATAFSNISVQPKFFINAVRKRSSQNVQNVLGLPGAQIRFSTRPGSDCVTVTILTYPPIITEFTICIGI